jgi:hypothetical protein
VTSVATWRIHNLRLGQGRPFRPAGFMEGGVIATYIELV